MGDRVAVLRAGVLQQVASPRMLYDRPANVFVAGFIGSPAMNLHRVPVDRGVAVLGGLRVPLPVAVLEAAARARLRHVELGVRPESLEVHARDHEGVDARVDLVEELGSDAYVHVTAELVDGPARLVVRTDGRKPIGKGEPVRVTPRPDELHVFDPDTGVRLGP